MATSAILGGVGAGINAIQGISSSVNSKNEGKRAARQLEQRQNMLYDTLMGDGGLMPQIMGGMGESISGLRDVTTANMGNMERLAQDLQSIVPQYRFDNFVFSDAPNVGGMQLTPLNTGQSYNFQPGSNLMDQTMDAFRTQEAGVRANALDQMASQSAADMRGLDAMLAGRGVGRGSGIASGALSDLAGQQGQQMAGLERDLATLGSQTALQGAQFDVNRALQEQQMQSGYNLGERQMLTDAQLGQQQLLSQYSLGVDQLRSQNWQADQSMRSQYGLARDQMASQYGLNQAQLRQQNILGAGNLLNTGVGQHLQAGLGMGQLYGGMLNPILSALLGMQNMGAQNVAAAGRGAGANPIGSSFMDLAKLFPQG